MKLVEVTDGLYQVEIAYGKIGSNLNRHFKPDEPSLYAEAEQFFVKQANAKLKKGYTIDYICNTAEKIIGQGAFV